jgi:hypothetical protein
MTSPARRTYHFDNCDLILVTDEYAETRFRDGLTCPALFLVNDDTRKTARECGYGDTDDAVRQMHFEHEAAHTFIAEAMGNPYSLCLRRVAEKIPWTFSYERDVEERATLAFQKFLNTGVVDSVLGVVFFELDELAAEFHVRFRL